MLHFAAAAAAAAAADVWMWRMMQSVLMKSIGCNWYSHHRRTFVNVGGYSVKFWGETVCGSGGRGRGSVGGVEVLRVVGGGGGWKEGWREGRKEGRRRRRKKHVGKGVGNAGRRRWRLRDERMDGMEGWDGMGWDGMICDVM